ncbi:MAG TPA: FecR domain-containing protein [Tepidisphaeraceae bacterium]|nr:FecR domain-containing protein [Tepidisphaeraceae bacterium]
MKRFDELLEMAGKYADGSATAEQVQTLQSALRDDAGFRKAFLRYMNVDAALGGAIKTVRTAQTHQAIAARSRAFGWRIVGAMSALAAVVAICLWVWTPSRHAPIAKTEMPPAVVLTAATEARWADPDVELSLRGGEIPAGLLRLESGVAEFRFAKGATALLLGPATIRFPGENQVFLQDGKVLCRCPTPESRITLTTPATQVVDLGTEFAVDASDDSGTRVAVVSGQVRVGTHDAQLLHKGESAVVGSDKVVHMAPLPPDAFAELFKADPSRISPQSGGGNLLPDVSFSGKRWTLTEGFAEPLPAGGAVHARGHRLWPSFRQTVNTGDVSGRLVVAKVVGTSASEDPLCERQSAILKIAFLDAGGREFATASRHFLQAGATPGTPVTGEVAAFAPAGTRMIQYQLLLSARSQPRGTVIFSGPRLFVADPSQATTKP